MLMLRAAFIAREEGLKNEALQGYWIEELDGMCFQDKRFSLMGR